MILEHTDAITKVDDALQIVGQCAAAGTNLVLIDAATLPAEFFDLKTRFAGEFVQKLQNYRLVVAAVYDPDTMHNERFTEYLREAMRSQTFRAFTDRAEAMAWLKDR